MPDPPERPQRRSIRLPGYDYAGPGAYFITICTYERRLLFEQPTLVSLVTAAWNDLPQHYPQAALDEFVVMPNHVHGILVLSNAEQASVGAGLKPARPAGSTSELRTEAARHGLPEIVRALKTFSARRINQACDTAGCPVWQRGFYEHVVRGERDLARIREYIVTNPERWAFDHENPEGRPDADERRFWQELTVLSRPAV